jgi:thiamine-monophosphate kinase
MARGGAETVAAVGEFPLIERLRRLVPTAGRGVVLGLGDDAAVLRFRGDVVATCDIQIEGVHFTWDTLDPADVGWRAAAVNLSDVAAMGGTPRFLLISLALRPDAPVQRVEAIYRGIGEIARAFGVVVAGGNVSSTTGPLCIDITALGETERVVARAGARPGERIWVSGAVGKAAAGRFLAGDPGAAVPGAAALVSAFRRPCPRVALGRALAGIAEVSAMIDTSDGTASDLIHLLDASRAGGRVDAARLPLPEGLREAAAAAGLDPAAWTLGGGEDYELLWTAGPGFDRRAPALAARLAVPLTCIGEVLPADAGRWLAIAGERQTLAASGWDHFRGTPR